MLRVLFLILLFSTALFPQQNYFQLGYGGTMDDEFRGVYVTSDGGTIATGVTESFGSGGKNLWLLKADANGNVQWSKAYGGASADAGNSVIELSTGGFLVGGVSSSFNVAGYDDMLVMRTDNAGNVVWSKKIGDSLPDNINQVLELNDGNYLLVGSSFLYNTNNSNDIVVIKMDQSGSVIWSKNIGQTFLDDIGYSAVELPNGNIIVVGETSFSSSSGQNGMVLCLTASGALRWNRQIGGTGSDIFNRVIYTSDNHFLAVGNTTTYGMGGMDMFCLKGDTLGNKLWAFAYGSVSMDGAYSISEKPGNGYFIAGFSSGQGPYNPVLMNIGQTGSLISTSNFGTSSSDVIWGGAITTGGSHILAGYSDGFSSPPGTHSGLLIRTDSLGLSACVSSITMALDSCGPVAFSAIAITNPGVIPVNCTLLVTSIGSLNLHPFCTNGIGFSGASDELKVYPVPSDDEFFIAGERLEHVTLICLTDIMGRVVFNKKMNGESTLRISTSSFPPGIYNTRLFYDDQSVRNLRVIIKR